MASLQPATLVSGHGGPMQGQRLGQAFRQLLARFEAEQVPHGGRYASSPAIQSQAGVLYVPPLPLRPYVRLALLLAGGLATLWWLSNNHGPQIHQKQKALPA